MASDPQPDGATPFGDRHQHPYVDQFTNEWAWRFEDAFNTIATTARSAEELNHRLAVIWDRLAGHKQEMADAWVHFVSRKLADAVAANPEAMQNAVRRDGRVPPEGPPATAQQAARPFFRRVEHPPFEPRKSNPTPQGWVTEPLGRWAGHETEVVYDPRRYAVMVTSESRSGNDVGATLEADGWERRAVDGDCTFWTRDKLAAARRGLARFDPAAAGLDGEGPGQEPAPVDRTGLAL